MGLFSDTNQRLSRFQKTGLFKILFVVFGVALVSSYLLPASIQSYEFDGLGQKIFDVLRESDLSKGEGPAVQFVEEGSVTIDGVTYVDERLTPIAASFFDENGRCVAASDATMLLVASQKPDWIPVFLLEAPGFTLTLWAASILWVLMVALFGLGWNFILLALISFIVTIPFWIGSAFFGVMKSPPNYGLIFAIVGIAFLAMTFALLTRLALLILSPATPTLAIAQSVVREAVRQRISVAFIIILVVILPMLPLS